MVSESGGKVKKTDYKHLGKNDKGKDIYVGDKRYFKKEKNYLVELPHFAEFGALKGVKEN